MNKRPLLWRTILRPKSLKIFAISFLIHPPLILLMGFVSIILDQKSHSGDAIFAIAVFPASLIMSYILYSMPIFIVSIFTISCHLLYTDRHTADDATVIVSGASFAAFFRIFPPFQAVSVLVGAVAGIISTLVALIATKKLRACDYPAGHAS